MLCNRICMIQKGAFSRFRENFISVWIDDKNEFYLQYFLVSAIILSWWLHLITELRNGGTSVRDLMPQSYLSSSQRVPECAGDTYSAMYVNVLPVWEVFVHRLGKFDLPSSQEFEFLPWGKSKESCRCIVLEEHGRRHWVSHLGRRMNHPTSETHFFHQREQRVSGILVIVSNSVLICLSCYWQ